MVTLQRCSLAPLVDVHATPHPVNWDQFFPSRQDSARGAPQNHKGSLDVEIGFGLGETLIRMARESPDRNFVGIEQNWERICKTLNRLNDLNNIRVLKVDARLAFERLFAEQTIDRVYSLFPCPWPKKKHVKHRLFSRQFFCLLNNRLKSGGEIKIVTDHGVFFQWMLDEVKETGFVIETKTIGSRYDTKFERKWVKAGKKNFFELSGVKKNHRDVSIFKDIPMKSYLVDHFDPAHFRFDPAVEETCSVIFKEMIFDPLKHKAMLHFVIQEEHLTQHFWVMIVKQDNRWRICKADGQTFFQTSGTSRALELVYQTLK